MITELVDSFGDALPNNSAKKSFPTPQAIACMTFSEFEKQVRLGYRASYVYLLAERITNEDLDPDSLLDAHLTTAQLKKKLLAIKGIGNYAAATLLMLLGRYDELPIDSVFREYVAKKYFNGKKYTDKKGQAIYNKWRTWKHLAYWFDVWQGYDEVI